MEKKIVCLDFDGVIHSYKSGWKGPRDIPDPAVPGAIEFIYDLVDAGYDVQIYSSRSHYFLGRYFMKRWLWKEACLFFGEPLDPYDMFHDTFGGGYSDKLMAGVSWPKVKPPAHVTIDDRALTFTGVFPSRDEIKNFKPWNKQKKAKKE